MWGCSRIFWITQGDARWRRHAARPLDGALRQQHEQWKSARSRSAAGGAGGGASGRLQGDRHLKFAPHTPMSNLLLSMLDKLGLSRIRSATAPGSSRYSDAESADVLKVLAAGPLVSRAFAQAGRFLCRRLASSISGLRCRIRRRRRVVWADIRSAVVSGTRPAAALLRAVGIGVHCFGGTKSPDQPAQIDHFCALVKDYKPDEMRKALEAAGLCWAPALGMPAIPTV